MQTLPRGLCTLGLATLRHLHCYGMSLRGWLSFRLSELPVNVNLPM